MTPTKKQQPGSYEVTQRDAVIMVVLSGRITSQLITDLAHEIEAASQKIQDDGKKPLAFIDVSAIKFRDIDSSVRRQSRQLLSATTIERGAIYGKAHIGLLVDYLGRASGASSKMRYFSDKKQALAWLHGSTVAMKRHSFVAFIIGVALTIIGATAVIGWQSNNEILTSFLPHLRPINPVAAVGLVALGVAFFCYWLNALKPLRVLGVTGVVLGLSVLLPLPIDHLLFSDAVKSAGLHTNIADSAGLCFILSGILGLLANRTGKWVQPLEYACAVLMGLIALFNIYGQLYAFDFIYGISDDFVMALNLAFAFLITSVGMIILVLLRRSNTALQRVTRSGWIIIVVLVLVQAATYSSWTQSRDRNISESRNGFSVSTAEINDQMNSRLQAYINALHGFRGLFVASTNVSQGDFEAYYQALNLKETYPGLRAMAFIAAVKTEQLPSFIASRRADTSLYPAGNPTFNISNLSAEPLHFISTYAADSPGSTFTGRDLTSIPGRSTIYNNALQADGHYGSGSITFAATATQPASEGFFIATPVRTANSSAPIGVVTANFNYKDFFDSVLHTIDNSNLAITVRDSDTQKIIYASGQQSLDATALTQEVTVKFAENQRWRLTIQAPGNFGITAGQARIPGSVLFFGNIFTLLLGGIFIQQTRARSQALALADAITEDLQIERDNIAALHIKDKAMLSGIGEGLIVVDPTGKIEVTNAAATKLLGFSEEEMLGKNAVEILRAIDEKGELIPLAKRPFTKSLATKKIVTTRLSYIRKDYGQLPVRVTVSPIVLRGELIGAIEVFSDITKEKQIEHMKDEFLSVASHELRTPMGAIRANISMILDGDYGAVNKDLVEPLTDMKASTIRLVDLVNDLLNVARIEAGRLRFTLTEFDIAEAAHTVVTDLAPLGKEKGVNVTYATDKSKKIVQADSDKVKQVLTNLVGNSLKFTDKGSITIQTKADGSMVLVTVTDTGMGIAPEDQKKLFGKFNQITSAQAGKPAGTGLGLYISRQIVKKMGGDMWIQESSFGKGSTFAFTVPRTDTTAAAKAKKSIDQEAKLHPDQI